MPDLDVTLHDIYKARQRIAGVATRTPVVRSPLLTERAGASVFLKAESLQRTGSFKIRGATNKMLGLTAEEKARGVITVSSGNHGRAVAYVARQLGISRRQVRNVVLAIRRHFEKAGLREPASPRTARAWPA